MRGFGMKWVVGSTIDLVALSLGMVVGGLFPVVGTLTGPVVAGVFLLIGQAAIIAVGAI